MSEIIIFLAICGIAGALVGTLIGWISTTIAGYWFVHNYVCHGCQDLDRKMTRREYLRGGGVHQGCEWRKT